MQQWVSQRPGWPITEWSGDEIFKWSTVIGRWDDEQNIVTLKVSRVCDFDLKADADDDDDDNGCQW